MTYPAGREALVGDSFVERTPLFRSYLLLLTKKAGKTPWSASPSRESSMED